MKRPETAQEGAEEGMAARSPRPARRPKLEKIYITPVDENDEPTGDSYALPKSEDYERFIKKNFPEGRYKVESRKGGQLPPLWSTYFNNVESLAPAEDEEDFDGDELPLELSPEAEERIAQRAARAAVEATEAMRPREPNPPATPYDVLKLQDEVIAREDRRRTMIREEVRAAMPEQPARVSERPPKANPSDPILALLASVAKDDPELRARIVDNYLGDGEKSGGVGALARAAFEHPIEAEQIIGAVMSGIQGVVGLFKPATNGNGNGPAPAQTSAPVQQANPVNTVLAIVVEDLKRNRRVGRSADAIEELFTKIPAYRAQLTPILKQSDEVILQMLSRAAGEDLSAYSHGAKFVSLLRDELFGEDEEADEETK
jgi:hypothetical protein